jgi:VanZ family protein
MVIAWESVGLSSDVTGGWITRTLGKLLPLSWEQLMLTNHVLRKAGHFTGYALLSWFAFRGWMETFTYRTEQALLRAGKRTEVRKRWHLRAAVLAVLCAMLVATLDEFHQAFVPGRTGVFRDVVLDTMGAVFAQFCLLLYWTGKRTPKAPAQAKLTNAAPATLAHKS